MTAASLTNNAVAFFLHLQVDSNRSRAGTKLKVQATPIDAEQGRKPIFGYTRKGNQYRTDNWPENEFETSQTTIALLGWSCGEQYNACVEANIDNNLRQM